MNGILNVYKNKGKSSFDVVWKVKKLAHEKKVGHTGTLDPEAEGVLPVCIGKATKIIDYIMTSDKEYKVKCLIGVETDTYDLEGKVIKRENTDNLTENDVKEALISFTGEYDQIPPMYSALKQNGVRLYELARKGIEVERKPRKVKILSIKDIVLDLPYLSFTVECSKGTYIRSLCHDIGEKLGLGAVMTDLERTRTSVFNKCDSVNIDDLTEENIEKYIIKIDDALKMYPAVIINEGFSKLLKNGVRVYDKRISYMKIENDVLYRVYDADKNFIGLGKKNDKGFKIEKLLLL
ncbi:tRNA pseudouridine(55) synthase TruB [Clostridium sp. BJN0001]|uniref:tRNA pseudouridine(55) synthase TruB n=1 Tax=Clostridium sp. BJN0001 TaxID=2930219 RepID=UPI001FD04A50|nr:tRNA pseudouridine(55) synthase TruB [Clostridium sp. BJN0001]